MEIPCNISVFRILEKVKSPFILETCIIPDSSWIYSFPRRWSLRKYLSYDTLLGIKLYISIYL